MFLKEEQRCHLYKKTVFTIPRKVTVTQWSRERRDGTGGSCAVNSGRRENGVVAGTTSHEKTPKTVEAARVALLLKGQSHQTELITVLLSQRVFLRHRVRLSGASVSMMYKGRR